MIAYRFVLGFPCAAIALGLLACGGSEVLDDSPATDSSVQSRNGWVNVTSIQSSADTRAALEDAMQGASMAAIDHQDAATVAGLELGTSIVYVFGNPQVGTPMMQENPAVALDLPLRMLVWEDDAGQAHVTYDGPAYLRARHGLAAVDEQLDTAGGALSNLATAATGVAVDSPEGDAAGISVADGLLRLESDASAEETWARLQRAIEGNPMLDVATMIDHQANAIEAGLTLGFNRVVFFGNPAVGTPLMQVTPQIAIDLPLKMLVVDNEGTTYVMYNDPLFVADRHGGVPGEDERLQTIAGALSNLAGIAAGFPIE